LFGEFSGTGVSVHMLHVQLAAQQLPGVERNGAVTAELSRFV